MCNVDCGLVIEFLHSVVAGSISSEEITVYAAHEVETAVQ